MQISLNKTSTELVILKVLNIFKWPMKGAFPKQTTYLIPSNLTVVGFERFYSGAGVRCVFFA